MPYIGTSPSNGVRRVFDYTATAGQTSFSGSDNNSQTLSYADSNFIDVFQNGVLLVSSDYTATTGTTVVLDTGATVSDSIQITVFDVFSVADTVSKADGGTFDGNVTMAGTLTASGRVLVDDTTEATTTTDGSLQTDGGFSVAKDIVVGDDIHLKSDSAQISFGADSEVTLDHTADTGLTLQGSGLNTNFSLLSFHTTNSTVPDLRLGKSSVNTVGTFAETANGEHIGQIRFTGQDTGGNTREAAQITVVQSDDSTSNSVPANMRFSTGGGERARFNDNGYIEFRGASQVRVNLGNAGTAGTNNSNWIRGSGNQVDLNTNGDGYGFEVSGNQKVVFANNGNVTNATGSYGTISDVTLKENISDASSQWDDIKALQVRKYSMKEDDLDSANKIGVIAQELETSGMNGLVEEITWNSETTKTVKYSILYMKSIKALQEAMTRIETLETAKTDLEARITALESK